MQEISDSGIPDLGYFNGGMRNTTQGMRNPITIGIEHPRSTGKD